MKCSSRPFVIGCDEAGRGPLAGPVACGIVCFLPSFFEKEVPDRVSLVGDSKKISEKNRVFLAEKIMNDKDIVSLVRLVSVQQINKKGINACIRQGFSYLIKKVAEREEIVVDGKHDYMLSDVFGSSNVSTLVRGDSKMREIAAASLIVKVARDTYMVALSKKRKYKIYEFSRHKGYGTRAHRNMIKQHGMSDQHRELFCRNIKNW